MLELWVACAIAVAAAGLAWPIAYRVGPAGTRRHRAALFVCFVVLFTLGSATLMPHARAWRQQRDVGALLAREPLFAAVLEDEPGLRAPLRAVLLRAFRDGQGGEAIQAGQRLLSPRLWRYVSRASDEAAVRLGRAVLESLEDLQQRDPEQCYRFFYRDRAGPSRDADADTNERLLSALGEVAVSARDGSAEPLDRKAAAKQVDAVYGHLRSEYGDEVDLLRNPQAPRADRARVCAVTIALYSELVALPPAAAGQTLRHVLGPPEPPAMPTPAAP